MAKRVNTALRILGIETSCDDTGAAVVEDGRRVLSNLVSSQLELHRPFGGVVPEVASRAHIERLLPLTDEALREAGTEAEALDAVAVARTPGLAGCLLTGVSFAKSLAYALGKPLIGVNHLEAHVYTTALDAPPEGHPPFPHLSLLVSGGHTALYRVNHWTDLQYLGGTRDDAAGEAFDKAAKVVELGFPGGPAIQKAAALHEGGLIDFPRPMLHRGMEFSFSGLKTAVINHVRGKEITEELQRQVAASFQRAVIEVLTVKTLRAAKEMELGHVSLVGGVSANEPLRQWLSSEAEREGIKVYLPGKRFSTDNGAMTAGLAYWHFREGRFADLTLNATA